MIQAQRRRYPVVRSTVEVVAEGSLGLLPASQVRSTDQAVAVLRALYGTLAGDREHFSAFYMNARRGIEAWNLVSTGIQSASLVHPREVFGPAIECRAASIMLAHNHPSGDPEPSPEDIEITHRLVAVGELVGIRIADHIVIGADRSVSFLERGLL